MNQSKIVKFIVSVLICQAAGFVGSLFTVPAINTWYVTLVKPGFNPPNWFFAPVWRFVFLLKGISLYLVWGYEWQVEVKGGVAKRKTWNP
ncbi:MAG: TspO/MBR family protein, partial [Candidatus Nealsonbacteria bacterium]|nr:TspO/MBR family protein [Candidatus Nealsonbacteria bacterium]